MSTYAIGDIQGCFDELKALLELIQFGDLDKLWFCGDLVNRGPKSLETLRFIRGLGSQAVTVLGNHDLHLLAVHHGFAKAKRSDTLDAILTAPDRNELLAWLQQQPLIYTDTQLGFTMTHAGIPPAWSIKRHIAWLKSAKMPCVRTLQTTLLICTATNLIHGLIHFRAQNACESSLITLPVCAFVHPKAN